MLPIINHLASINLNHSIFGARDQTIGSVQLCLSITWETIKPFDKSAFRKFASSGIFPKWLCTVFWSTPNLCNSLLWDTKTGHTKYYKIKFQLNYCPKIGNRGIHCLSWAPNGLTDLCRGQPGIISSCAIRKMIMLPI